MEKDVEQHPGETRECPAASAPGTDGVTSRRRFTRNAVASGAVVFTLGNRAAWGAAHPDDICMSSALLTSFVANGNQFASLQPGQTVDVMKAQEILQPGRNGDRHTHGNQTCVRDA
jgi:hypothetical protein